MRIARDGRMSSCNRDAAIRFFGICTHAAVWPAEKFGALIWLKNWANSVESLLTR